MRTFMLNLKIIFFMKKVVSVFALSMLFFACKNDKKPVETTTVEDTKEVVEENVNPDVVEITLEANDNMQFDKNEIKVPVGKEVKLTLKHTGKMSKDLMGHNFVLLNEGADMAAFAAEAMKAKDSDYIPASKASDIMAHTDLIGGGESTSVTFTVEKPGTYEYLCSFPAHYAMMKGKLIAE